MPPPPLGLGSSTSSLSDGGGTSQLREKWRKEVNQYLALQNLSVKAFVSRFSQGKKSIKVKTVSKILQRIPELNISAEEVNELIALWDKKNSGTIPANVFSKGLKLVKISDQERKSLEAIRKLTRDEEEEHEWYLKTAIAERDSASTTSTSPMSSRYGSNHSTTRQPRSSLSIEDTATDNSSVSGWRKVSETSHERREKEVQQWAHDVRMVNGTSNPSNPSNPTNSHLGVANVEKAASQLKVSPKLIDRGHAKSSAARDTAVQPRASSSASSHGSLSDGFSSVPMDTSPGSRVPMKKPQELLDRFNRQHQKKVAEKARLSQMHARSNSANRSPAVQENSKLKPSPKSTNVSKSPSMGSKGPGKQPQQLRSGSSGTRKGREVLLAQAKHTPSPKLSKPTKQVTSSTVVAPTPKTAAHDSLAAATEEILLLSGEHTERLNAYLRLNNEATLVRDSDDDISEITLQTMSASEVDASSPPPLTSARSSGHRAKGSHQGKGPAKDFIKKNMILSARKQAGRGRRASAGHPYSASRVPRKKHTPVSKAPTIATAPASLQKQSAPSTTMATEPKQQQASQSMAPHIGTESDTASREQEGGSLAHPLRGKPITFKPIPQISSPKSPSSDKGGSRNVSVSDGVQGQQSQVTSTDSSPSQLKNASQHQQASPGGMRETGEPLFSPTSPVVSIQRSSKSPFQPSRARNLLFSSNGNTSGNTSGNADSVVPRKPPRPSLQAEGTRTRTHTQKATSSAHAKVQATQPEKSSSKTSSSTKIDFTQPRLTAAARARIAAAKGMGKGTGANDADGENSTKNTSRSKSNTASKKPSSQHGRARVAKAAVPSPPSSSSKKEKSPRKLRPVGVASSQQPMLAKAPRRVKPGVPSSANAQRAKLAANVADHLHDGTLKASDHVSGEQAQPGNTGRNATAVKATSTITQGELTTAPSLASETRNPPPAPPAGKKQKPRSAIGKGLHKLGKAITRGRKGKQAGPAAEASNAHLARDSGEDDVSRGGRDDSADGRSTASSGKRRFGLLSMTSEQINPTSFRRSAVGASPRTDGSMAEKRRSTGEHDRVGSGLADGSENDPQSIERIISARRKHRKRSSYHERGESGSYEEFYIGSDDENIAHADGLQQTSLTGDRSEVLLFDLSGKATGSVVYPTPDREEGEYAIISDDEGDGVGDGVGTVDRLKETMKNGSLFAYSNTSIGGDNSIEHPQRILSNSSSARKGSAAPKLRLREHVLSQQTVSSLDDFSAESVHSDDTRYSAISTDHATSTPPPPPPPPTHDRSRQFVISAQDKEIRRSRSQSASFDMGQAPQDAADGDDTEAAPAPTERRYARLSYSVSQDHPHGFHQYSRLSRDNIFGQPPNRLSAAVSAFAEPIREADDESDVSDGYERPYLGESVEYASIPSELSSPVYAKAVNLDEVTLEWPNEERSSDRGQGERGVQQPVPGYEVPTPLASTLRASGPTNTSNGVLRAPKEFTWTGELLHCDQQALSSLAAVGADPTSPPAEADGAVTDAVELLSADAVCRPSVPTTVQQEVVSFEVTMDPLFGDADHPRENDEKGTEPVSSASTIVPTPLKKLRSFHAHQPPQFPEPHSFLHAEARPSIADPSSRGQPAPQAAAKIRRSDDRFCIIRAVVKLGNHEAFLRQEHMLIEPMLPTHRLRQERITDTIKRLSLRSEQDGFPHHGGVRLDEEWMSPLSSPATPLEGRGRSIRHSYHQRGAFTYDDSRFQQQHHQQQWLDEPSRPHLHPLGGGIPRGHPLGEAPHRHHRIQPIGGSTPQLRLPHGVSGYDGEYQRRFGTQHPSEHASRGVLQQQQQQYRRHDFDGPSQHAFIARHLRHPAPSYPATTPQPLYERRRGRDAPLSVFANKTQSSAAVLQPVHSQQQQKQHAHPMSKQWDPLLANNAMYVDARVGESHVPRI